MMKKAFRLMPGYYLLLSCFYCASQELPNTILKEGKFVSPPANLKDVEWIQGHWKGEAFEGVSEEFWTAPSGGSMSSIYKSVSKGKTALYEIQTISEENNSLILRLKHFNADLKGWEEKDRAVEFPLVKIVGKKAYFSGLTYQLIDENHLIVFVVLSDGKGENNEMKFSYERVL